MLPSPNVIYHYFPEFRRQIFAGIGRLVPDAHFIYGRNSRFGVAAIADEKHHLRKNWFFGNLIVQSLGLSTLRLVMRNDSVILGDLKFVNSWFYAILGRLSGRKVLFWTHGVLQPESGVKWAMRKAYYNLADGLLLYSEHEAQLMRELGYAKPLHVVGNANYDETDLETLPPASSNSEPGGVCYIGRISPEKGLADFAKLAASSRENKVVLVGPATAGCEAYRDAHPNLVFKEPEYDFARLRNAVAGCDTLVMFSAAGLSLFTAIVLGLRPVIKTCRVQKPEYHLLKAYGLVMEFEDFEGLAHAIENPALDDSEFAAAREKFLRENSAEMVAGRVVAVLDQQERPPREVHA